MKPSYEDLLKQLKSARSAVRVWETTMMQACGEDGPASVAAEIKALRSLRDTALVTLHSENEELQRKVEVLAVESAQAQQVISECKSYFIAGITSQIRPTNEGYLHMICDTFLDDTKATDAALAEIRAQGVDAFADDCENDVVFVEPEDEELYVLMAEHARAFSAKLRKESVQ